MSVRDTRWHRLRRQLRPVTTRIPGGHVITESATYLRLALPPPLHPDRRFVVFAQGRSGSTLLTDLLNRHPDVYCADEILTWPRRSPIAYATACSTAHRGATYGFKVKIYHLTEAQRIDPHDFLAALHGRGWSVLHLQRRNVLRQALSSLVAAARGGVYHVTAGDGRPPPVRVDPTELLRVTAQRSALCEAEAAALAGIPHLALVYEDDLLDPSVHQRTAARAMVYLGLEEVPVSTTLRKIAPERGLDQLLINADEVSAAVRGSPFAALLDRP